MHPPAHPIHVEACGLLHPCWHIIIMYLGDRANKGHVLKNKVYMYVMVMLRSSLIAERQTLPEIFCRSIRIIEVELDRNCNGPPDLLPFDQEPDFAIRSWFTNIARYYLPASTFTGNCKDGFNWSPVGLHVPTHPTWRGNVAAKHCTRRNEDELRCILVRCLTVWLCYEPPRSTDD